MIEGRTILCFASGYDAPPTSKHHVMHLLAERNVVLWVNYHASRTPSASASDLRTMAAKLKQVFAGVSSPRRNLHVVTPMVLPLPKSEAARSINRELLVRRIKRALARVQTGPLQIWSFTPDVAYLIDSFKCEKVVYYCVDDHAQFTGYDKEQVLRDEAELCRKADLVVTTSSALLESKRGLNPNTILVTHGVDYEHFSKATSDHLAVPDDIARIPHPIFGFFGLIRDWIDLDLIADVARLKPDWHFVLIGDSKVDLTPYRSLANMHFLGPRPYAQLPAYCKGFDAGLIPFKINELTLAVNPIKLREYLSAGLPVISTPLPEVLVYKEMVCVVRTPEEFVASAGTIPGKEDGARLRQSEAMAEETWDHKLTSIAGSLERVCDRRSQQKELGRPSQPRSSKIVVGYDGGGFSREAEWLLSQSPEDVSIVLAATRDASAKLGKTENSSRQFLRVYSIPGQHRLVSSPWAGGVGRLARCISRCLVLMKQEHPDGVVVVGASIAVPLFFCARMFRVKTVFIESVTRVTRPTRTGRAVSLLGIADRFYVQWPESVRMYRHAVYVGRLA